MRNQNKNWKENFGITLIALVVTIIILLVLVGVTISMTNSEDGIIKETKEAKKSSELESIKEQIQLELLDKLLDKDELTDGDLEDVFKEYGEVEYDENGRVKDFKRSDGSKILVSDVWRGKVYPKINQNDVLKYDLKVIAVNGGQVIDEVNSRLNSGYKVNKLAFYNNESKYKIQKVWFNDTDTRAFTVKYGRNSLKNDYSSLNIKNVAQVSGTIDVNLSGEIIDDDQYQITWKNKITKRIIIKNIGTLSMIYKINLENTNASEAESLAKYLKVSVEDKNGQEINDLSTFEGTLNSGEEAYYNVVLSLEE